MIALKLYTPIMGGRWTKYNPPIEKDTVMHIIKNGINFKIIDKNKNFTPWSALMFSDGTIYDKDKGFRDEKDFPKDETIEYMNKILNGEI